MTKERGPDKKCSMHGRDHHHIHTNEISAKNLIQFQFEAK